MDKNARPTEKPENAKNAGTPVENGAPSKKDLSEKDLKKVSGGAFPTAVNDQITDSVT